MRMDQLSKITRKVAFASFVGTTIEWYDFYLYGAAAALIFNQLFFPALNPIAGIIAAYSTYAIGFFSRPIGGIIFGHFGDKIGRKNMLVLTLLIMGISTFCIGLLPTYHQIGIWAPILLTVLRCLQGFGVGGEWGGAIVMVAEYSHSKRRGFYSSWPNAGAPCGLVLAIVMYLIFSSLTEEQFIRWGWRIPFLIGFLLVGVGIYIRNNLFESPLFIKAVKRVKSSKIPVIEIMKTSKKNFLLAIGARFIESGSYYIFSVFILSYATIQLQLPKITILVSLLIASIVEIFTIPYFGYLSDQIGRRPVYIAGSIIVMLFSFPYFWLLQTKNTILILFAMIFALGIGHALMHGPQAAFYSELFKTQVRYSGAATAYHLSAALSGGLAPILATLLIAETNSTTGVSIYMILMGCITILSVYLAKETKHHDLI